MLEIKELDPTILTLSDDQKIVALKGIKDMHHGLSYVHEMIESDTLSIGMRDNMCSLLDHYLKELAEPIGYASQAAARIEEQHAKVRKLNGRIHELERQLGEAMPIDMIPNTLRNLRDGIASWWGNQMSGSHIFDFDYGPYGTVDIKFSFSFDRISSWSKSPTTDKTKKVQAREDLENQGYIFVQDESEHRLLDCDKNRELLFALLKETFPSITIRYWENRSVHRKDHLFTLWGIHATIREISDLVVTKDVAAAD